MGIRREDIVLTKADIKNGWTRESLYQFFKEGEGLTMAMVFPDPNKDSRGREVRPVVVQDTSKFNPMKW